MSFGPCGFPTASPRWCERWTLTPDLSSDLDRFLDRIEDPVAETGPHVRHVDAAAPRHHLAQLDQLVGVGPELRRVVQARSRTRRRRPPCRPRRAGTSAPARPRSAGGPPCRAPRRARRSAAPGRRRWWRPSDRTAPGTTPPRSSPSRCPGCRSGPPGGAAAAASVFGETGAYERPSWPSRSVVTPW